MKTVILFLSFAFVVFSQTPQKVAITGANMYLNQQVTFGGNPYLTMTTGQDTLSDPIVVEVATIRPSQAIVIEYAAIADDSTTSGYRFDIHSRICTNPSLSTGCPSFWLTPRFRKIYNTGNFADTAVVSLIPEDTTQVSHTTMLPSGNQFRLRFQAGTATSNYFKNIYVRGF